MKKNKSFTLIELLIASSIVVIILVGIYSAFSSGIFGYRNIENNLTTSQTALKVLNRINSDLRNCFIYTDDDTKFKGENKQLSFLTLDDDSFALVSYSVEENKLLWLCRRNQEALKVYSIIKPLILASDIKEIVFNYAYINADRHALEWKEAWDDQSAFPVAVKVKLTIKHKTEQNFERTIFL